MKNVILAGHSLRVKITGKHYYKRGAFERIEGKRGETEREDTWTKEKKGAKGSEAVGQRNAA